MNKYFDKIKIFIKNNKKCFVIIFMVVVVVASGIMLYLLHEKKSKPEVITTSTTATNNESKLFRGYKVYEALQGNIVTYNLKNKYEFIYPSSSNEAIMALNNGEEYVYEVILSNGQLSFLEQVIIEGEQISLKYTHNSFDTNFSELISSFFVVHTCEASEYTIIALDKKKNVYRFSATGDESIQDIIKGFKKVKTISGIKNIGYYNLNNTPYITCEGYELVYEDINGNIRHLDDNKLFFNDAYYSFIGADYYDQLVYVLKDGTMRFGIGNSAKLNDGDAIIKYRGSFYYLGEDNTKEDLYIISDDDYLYFVENMNESSSPKLSRLRESKIKKIGMQVMTNSESFTTNYYRVIVLFEDGETFKIENISGIDMLS